MIQKIQPLIYLYLYLRYISKVSSPTLLISNTKPLCDETNATVANNSARVHEDLMVPSALRAAPDLRCSVTKVKRSWRSKKVCQMPGTKNTHRYRHRGLKTADLDLHEVRRPVRRLCRDRDLPLLHPCAQI